MTQTADSQFLNVPILLEKSHPRALGVRLWQVLGVFLLVVLVSTYLTSKGEEAARLVNLLSGVLMVGLIVGLSVVSWVMVRKARLEQFQLEGIEELMRLRRWPEAGIMLQQMLSRPTRTPQARAQALIFLTGVLARYNRFDDAIAVQDHLLQHVPLDGGTVHGIKLARAMAMLREDHLFDADRAINELRQQVSRAVRARDVQQEDKSTGSSNTGPIPSEEPPQSASAGLALVELYRDVKTGHPAEAIELFNATLPAMREQLGQRVSDAYVLAAKAYDLLGRESEAQAHYEKATLLASAAELHRRYPETASLSAKYHPASLPKEVGR